mmetsp:Transcript_41521/g.88590  ORF Transcript_41521/g.88590 Transcript_41521/m.88590 type:complete len:405 (-) Transcript_41521:288-1502(-)
MKVGIVGGGPGGLTLAHALLTLPGRRIDEVRVYDRADVLAPGVGGGLQLSCGASVLQELGIDISGVASPLRRVLSRQPSGKQLLELDVQQSMVEADAPLISGDGCFAIMRSSLQAELARQLPGEVMQFGRRVAAVRPNGSGSTTLCFEDGTEDTPDLVVGCDGIASVVKGGCFPSEPPPTFSGVKITFAVCPPGVRPIGSEECFHQWLGDGAYCLSASYGGENDCLALCYSDDDPASENAGWQDAGEARGACEARLREARFPQEVLALASSAERFYETSVYFRQPSLSWFTEDGSAVLVGDAAHAMPPFLGQGANQAILDAFRLATELKQVGGAGEHTDVLSALRAYRGKRWWPTTRLLANSRLLGFLETQSGGGSLFRDAFFFTTGQLGIAKRVFLDGATMRP